MRRTTCDRRFIFLPGTRRRARWSRAVILPGVPAFGSPARPPSPFSRRAGWPLLYVNYQTGYDGGLPVLNSEAFLYKVVFTGPVMGMLFQF